VLSRQFDALLAGKLRSSLIVPHTFANGAMVTPLRLNESHFIPDTTMNVTFSPIIFNLNLAQVSLLLNVSMFNFMFLFNFILFVYLFIIILLIYCIR
jgi:hypothetical protein